MSCHYPTHSCRPMLACVVPGLALLRCIPSPERNGLLPFPGLFSLISEAVLTQALNFLPRYLLEQRDVEVNVRDKWDSTPL